MTSDILKEMVKAGLSSAVLIVRLPRARSFAELPLPSRR